MSSSERERWNARYRAGEGPGEPSSFLTGIQQLPTAGTALDVAGGAGRNALWLAARGLDVTLADISDAGLEIAAAAARARSLPVETVRCDLATTELPPGPWDVIVCIDFLERRVFSQFAATMADRGLLVASLATVRNRERHARPSHRYLSRHLRTVLAST